MQMSVSHASAMTAPTPRQAALERLNDTVRVLAEDYPALSNTRLENILTAFAAVEQAAPEGYRCPGCVAWGEKHTIQLFQLADARAAIREAAQIIKDRTELMCETADDPLPDVRAWLTRLAVVAALKEKKG